MNESVEKKKRKPGINSRSKGQRAERLAIEVLQPIVSATCKNLGIAEIALERNLMQSMKGGYDIVGLPWMALEVKHCETFSFNDWWKQALKQTRPGQTTVLMYKRNQVPFRVRMSGGVWHGPKIGHVCIVDVALEDFLQYFASRVLHELLLENSK